MRFQETDQSNPGQLDFVPRERRGQGQRIVVAFAVTMALIFVLSYSTGAFGPIISLLVVAALCVYIVVGNQKNLDLLMSTEYQNLLYAQAVSLGSEFSIFVRRNGTIVYADRGLRDVLGQSYGEAQALESIFERASVSKTDRERLMGSIYNNMADRLIFPIRNVSGESVNYILTVEPIPRPAGFVLLRGREYRDERSGAQVLPDMLRATSADKLDHLLGKTPVAHYATDAFGRFEYVNSAFEAALGFRSGEVISERTVLQAVVYQFGTDAIGDDYTLADFHGEAVLRNTENQLIDCLLFQKVIRDESGKTIGATGSIITSGMLDAQ